MHLGANETVDPHTGLPVMRWHHRVLWHGPYLGPDPRDIYHARPIVPWHPVGLGDIETVDVTPAQIVDSAQFLTDFPGGTSFDTAPPLPDFITPVAPDIQPPTIDIVGSGPFTTGPAPAVSPPGVSSNWFSADVLPLVGLAAQAYEATVTHMMPGVTTPGGVLGPGGLTPAQYAAMTPAQRAAYLQQYGSGITPSPIGATSADPILAALGGSSGMLLLGGVGLFAMIMLMQRK